MRSHALVVAGTALLIVLAGCGGAVNAGAGGGGGDGVVARESAAGESGGDGGSGGGGADADAAGSGNGPEPSGGDGLATRVRVRTGQVTLRVESYDAASAKLRALARSTGGFVSDSSERTHTRGNRTWTTGHLVLRVPSGEFESAMARIKEQGRVRSASTDSEVVADRLTDIEARLENLRAQRARLRDLYAEANRTRDVLRIDERLTEVQGEIERLEATRRRLQNRVEFATVTVELREPAPEPRPDPAPERWYETGVVAAFLESVSGALTVLRAAAVGAAFLAPYALLFGAPLAGAAYLARRRGLL